MYFVKLKYDIKGHFGRLSIIDWYRAFANIYVPPTEGGGHIVFGAVPVGVGVGVGVSVGVGVRVRVASFLRDIF